MPVPPRAPVSRCFHRQRNKKDLHGDAHSACREGMAILVTYNSGWPENIPNLHHVWHENWEGAKSHEYSTHQLTSSPYFTGASMLCIYWNVYRRGILASSQFPTLFTNLLKLISFKPILFTLHCTTVTNWAVCAETRQKSTWYLWHDSERHISHGASCLSKKYWQLAKLESQGRVVKWRWEKSVRESAS